MIRINREIDAGQLRWFGVSMASLFGSFAAVAWWRDALMVSAGLAAVGFLVLIVYYLVAASKRPIIKAYFAVTWPIAATVSTVLLSMLYYLVLTPIGLCLKLLGRDPLQKRPDANMDSYWTAYPESPRPDHYFRQY